MRGAGARRSYGWQRSIGRIARLLRWEVARPRGSSRALAGRKLEAPPDAGHEWRDGETVCGHARAIQVSRVHWPRGLKPRGFTIRPKAFSGFCPSCSYQQDEAGSYGSQVKHRASTERERPRASASGGKEAESGVSASDEGNVRDRCGSGEGRARSEKVQDLSASSALKRRRSRGASGRRRSKLAARIALPTFPFLVARTIGIEVKAPETKTTMA
jgi:hypothetical protein